MPPPPPGERPPCLYPAKLISEQRPEDHSAEQGFGLEVGGKQGQLSPLSPARAARPDTAAGRGHGSLR